MGRSPIDSDDSELNDSIPAFDLTEEISFLDQSINCCICFVDLVNSTKVTAEIPDRQKIGRYYSIFINTMAILARNYNAKIVKNAGDALIFYFPETSDSGNEVAFKDVLECITTMISARDMINAKLYLEDLPPINYRISADYGKVEVATSSSSKREDLFGSTMNMCAKINSMAEPNGIVIGGDLYQIMKSFSFIHGYKFIELREGCSLGFSRMYPVYCILSKNNNNDNDNNTAEIHNRTINPLFTYKSISKIRDIQSKQQPLQLLDQSQQKQLQQQKYSANIMVVDDEPDTLFTYECFLSEEGHNVRTFNDPQEALKHFIQLSDPSSHYQLILLDVRMPRLNGLKLFNMIKTISRNTKIMFVSALDIAEELISILPDITSDDIIKKPVEREYFVSRINSILSN
jgi:CheY-like chemotaxis protein/class 3 adenylate cyclase